jgi:hypothetical protein
MEIMGSIRFCDNVKSPGSTAGCGKPHVRWCGRGDGSNPVTPSRLALTLRTILDIKAEKGVCYPYLDNNLLSPHWLLAGP